ncbi:SDR family NAD(P)-dependent oxidoreductase [bacterium]|nr:SDR family NAD(P)-dependent oxidoreductase [bacterium]QQR59733.1 MAG: SDR family NAD(P)-dependent oxidoreductase [Candidatus Melainabacteria bacterium]
MDSKTIVIFGGYGTIGCELAKRLAAKGFTLILCARNEYKLSLVADSLDANYCCVDVSDPEQVLTCIEGARKQFSKIDGIAFCVGSALRSPSRLAIKRTLTCIRYSADAMEDKGGLITFSMCENPDEDMKMLIKSATSLYEKRNIYVKAIQPGPVEEVVDQMEKFFSTLSKCSSEDSTCPDQGFKTSFCEK